MNTEDKIKVVIIDDDNLVALSLKTILEATGRIEILATGKDGTDAMPLFTTHRPDVLVMDIRMSTMTGLDAANGLLSKYPDAKILLLTTFNDDEYIIKAIKFGVKGYILKQDFEGIGPAVLAVAGGQTVFGGEVMGKIPSLMMSSASDHSSANEAFLKELEQYEINEKELGIIELVAEGLNNKEIADRLFLSEGTVRNYLSSILEKLALRDRTQLAVYYLNHKISK